jgi:hypothetical protein
MTNGIERPAVVVLGHAARKTGWVSKPLAYCRIPQPAPAATSPNHRHPSSTIQAFFLLVPERWQWSHRLRIISASPEAYLSDAGSEGDPVASREDARDDHKGDQSWRPAPKRRTMGTRISTVRNAVIAPSATVIMSTICMMDTCIIRMETMLTSI